MTVTACQHLVGLCRPPAFPHPLLQMRVRTAFEKARLGLGCDSAANAVTSDAVTPLQGATRRVTSRRLDTPSSDRSRQPHHTGRIVTCTTRQENWRRT